MADSINKADLVAAIAADSGQGQAAVSTVVYSFFAVLAKSLKDGKKVAIPGWLSVEPTQRAAARGSPTHSARYQAEILMEPRGNRS